MDIHIAALRVTTTAMFGNLKRSSWRTSELWQDAAPYGAADHEPFSSASPACALVSCNSGSMKKSSPMDG